MSQFRMQALDMLRKFEPGTTVGEIVAEFEYLVIHGECQRCAKPISRLQNFSDDQAWVHDGPGRLRGCRAASLNDDGWNDALLKEWKATPKPE